LIHCVATNLERHTKKSSMMLCWKELNSLYILLNVAKNNIMLLCYTSFYNHKKNTTLMCYTSYKQRNNKPTNGWGWAYCSPSPHLTKTRGQKKIKRRQQWAYLVLLHVNVQNQKNDNKLEVDCLFVARKQRKVEAYVGMVQVEGRRCCGRSLHTKIGSHKIGSWE
jgi:hypothetical protein